MAYDMTQDPNWVKGQDKKAAIARSRKMTPKQQVSEFKRLIGNIAPKNSAGKKSNG